MPELINYVTLFRNLIFSSIFGLLVPYLLYIYIDPKELVLNINYLLINGGIFVGVYTAFGLFKKETVIRFLIGCGWIATLIYFYTVGNNFFTVYLPHCGFGYICLEGEVMNIKISVGFNYAWVCISLLVLTGLQILRNLIKPDYPKVFKDYFKISNRLEK